MDNLLHHPWFKSIGFKTILDIGANTGQFVGQAHYLFPEARIFAFEPLPDCFQELLLNTSTIKNQISFNLGLGDEKGTFPFERNLFTPSSSFLKMAELHKEAYSFTKQTETVQVNMDRLDSVAKTLLIEEPLLVKIDVQGFEDKVLRGGRETIEKAHMVVVETSYVTLYENQPLFDDIYQIMKEMGFCYHGFASILGHPSDGRPLQEDSIFMKKPVPVVVSEAEPALDTSQDLAATASP